jgi:hypothetical protein
MLSDCLRVVRGLGVRAGRSAGHELLDRVARRERWAVWDEAILEAIESSGAFLLSG